MKLENQKYASLSLVSTIVTAILTSFHHAYEIGFLAVVLLLLFAVSPIVLMQWFRKTGSKASLAAYGLLNTWLVVGLGMVDGLWNHTLKPLGVQFHALIALHGGGVKVVEKAIEGNTVYEVAGILTFVASMFAAYYGYKFIRLSRQSESEVANINDNNSD